MKFFKAFLVGLLGMVRGGLLGLLPGVVLYLLLYGKESETPLAFWGPVALGAIIHGPYSFALEWRDRPVYVGNSSRGPLDPPSRYPLDPQVAAHWILRVAAHLILRAATHLIPEVESLDDVAVGPISHAQRLVRPSRMTQCPRPRPSTRPRARRRPRRERPPWHPCARSTRRDAVRGSDAASHRVGHRFRAAP